MGGQMNEPEAYEFMFKLLAIAMAVLCLMGVVGYFLERVIDIERPKKKKKEIPPYLKGPFK